MRSSRWWLMFLAVPALSAAAVNLEATNPGDVVRERSLVGVEWKALRERIPALTPENVRVREESGRVLVCQAVDNDGDGELDELLFLADFAGRGTRRFQVAADSSLQAPELVERVFARYVPERKDDFAWENDLVGFRAYGPGLREGVENAGIDCFMKRVKYPIINRWYREEKLGKSYHVDTGTGYDGYKVGASLGCGGTAVWYEGRLFLSEVYTAWRLFADGPLRAVFELCYGPWEVGGKIITERKLIRLDLGRRLFQVKDSFLVNGRPGRLEVAVGVTTHEGQAEAYGDRDRGFLYAWEKIDGYYLGTGVVVPVKYLEEYRLLDSKKKDEGHAIFIVNTGDDGSFSYAAGFAWEKAGEIVRREEWEKYLADFAREPEAVIRAVIK